MNLYGKGIFLKILCFVIFVIYGIKVFVSEFQKLFIVDDGNEMDLGHVLLLVIENLGLFVMLLFNHFRILLWINYINVMICFILYIIIIMVIQSSVLNRSMNICTCWNCKLKAVHKLKFYLTSQNISKPSINGYEILYW